MCLFFSRFRTYEIENILVALYYPIDLKQKYFGTRIAIINISDDIGNWERPVMYKIRNVYKDCHIMDLNLMEAAQYKRSNISGVEIFTLLSPLVLIFLLLGASILAEIGFFAECMNVPGGDICHISLK